jgi:diamine N-acetyltransferase
MLITTQNNQQVFLRELHPNDFDDLVIYLQNLTPQTKTRFGPHNFDKQSIIDLYISNKCIGYIAQDGITNKIIAYAIIKQGYLEHDSSRLNRYGIILNHNTDCTFAPSVADDWQSCGIGYALFNYIVLQLKNTQTKRMMLWGGVQKENDKAVNYYKKLGFYALGTFNYNGENFDMVFDIKS